MQVDGRSYWGIAFFIYCWCVDADRVFVEQPATIIPDFYLHPSQCVKPCEVSDSDGKNFCFYKRGRLLLHRDVVDWRSSWTRFPNLCRAVAQAAAGDIDASNNPQYLLEIEEFAAAWFDEGLPVPYDYAAPDAQPALDADRLYHRQRRRGDCRGGS
ncbi:MAG: hypothetical protein SGPRY_011984 [Prymnesium sp.]